MSRYGLDEGVQQLTRAAELGLPEALVNQGFSYLIGPGIQEDQEAEGLKLLELAAQSGDPVSGAEEMRSLAKQLVQNYRQCRDRFRHKPLEPQVDPLSWIGLIVVLALPLVLLWVFCMFRERPKLLAGDASPNFCIHLVDGTQRSFHEFLCQRHVPTLLVFYHTLQPLGKDEGHLLKVFQELEEIDQLVSYRDEDLQCIMVNVESMQKCQDIAASRPFGTVVHGHAVPPKAYSATGPVRKMLVDVEGKIVKIDVRLPDDLLDLLTSAQT
ncbi:unnamed protein product [Durusdinium trenchii]|uniref:Thioredoxin domain-containing protein n=1 Tax=Durusdinium trenchii TaxID=1381693 RepID=A0ABP0SF83_9DINO